MSATQTQAQEAFAARMAEKHITPLWTVANRLVMREPTPKIPPVYWNYQRDVRPYILEAAEVISAAEAHRRVLVLNNPTLKHGATHTLTCAISPPLMSWIAQVSVCVAPCLSVGLLSTSTRRCASAAEITSAASRM